MLANKMSFISTRFRLGISNLVLDNSRYDLMQIACVRKSITYSDEITYADGNGLVSVGRDSFPKLTFR